MNSIKIALIAVAALAFGFAANAQTYKSETLTPLSAAIVANTSSNTTSVIDVRRQDLLSLQLTAASGSTNAPTLTLTFVYSVDGTTYGSVPTTTWALKLPATTASTTITTNLSVYGYGYVKLATVACSNDTDPVTLTALKYAIKNPAK